MPVRALMNGVEIGGNMDTLKDKMVTTQKEHTCWGCGIKHPKGTRMRYTVCVDGGICRLRTGVIYAKLS